VSKWSGRGQPPTRRKLKRLRQARLLEQPEQRHAPIRLSKRWVWHGRELERMMRGCIPEEEGGGVHVLED
jgi:hypothetical protein